MIHLFKVGGAAAAFVLASSAQAGLILETEPNDTPATANFVGSFGPPGGSIAIDGVKTPGDVDWFEIELTDMATLLLSTIGSDEDPLPDTQLQLVAGDGVTIIDWDDDDGPGLLSALNVVDLPAGTYFIGVSSFADVTFSTGLTELFDGIDNQTGVATVDTFTYKLTIGVNVIPAPGVAAVLALAGIASRRRRR